MDQTQRTEDIFCIDACGHLALSLQAFKHARTLLHLLSAPESPVPEFNLHRDIKLFDTVHGYREKSNMGEPRLSIPSSKLPKKQQVEYVHTLSSYAQFVTNNPDLIDIVETEICRDFWGSLVKHAIPERVIPVLLQEPAMVAKLKESTFRLIAAVNPCKAAEIGGPEGIELFDARSGLILNKYVVQSLRHTKYGEGGTKLWDLMRGNPYIASARKDAGEKAFLWAVTHLLSEEDSPAGRVIFVTKDTLAGEMIERYLNGRHASGDPVGEGEYAYYGYRMRPRYVETYVMGELSFYVFLEDLYARFESTIKDHAPGLAGDHPIAETMARMDRTLHVLFNQVIVGNNALKYGSECVYSADKSRQYEAYDLSEIYSLQPGLIAPGQALGGAGIRLNS